MKLPGFTAEYGLVAPTAAYRRGPGVSGAAGGRATVRAQLVGDQNCRPYIDCYEVCKPNIPCCYAGGCPEGTVCTCREKCVTRYACI